MKKLLVGLLIISAIFAGFARAEQMPFQLFYWIAGNVPAAGDIKADGRMVVLYKEGAPNNAATATIVNNRFILNAYDMYPLAPVPGETAKLAIVKGDDGVGMDPIDVIISDKGIILFIGADSPIKLTRGSGVATPIQVDRPEPAPKIKIYLGNKLYQKDFVAKGYKRVVSEKPEIKIEASIDAPYAMASDISGYKITIDENSTYERNINLTAADIKEKSVFAGASGQTPKISGIKITGLVAEPLSAGKHTITVTARSSGQSQNGIPSEGVEVAEVEVVGGKLKLLSQPITFPSPFSIFKDKQVLIQYELSSDADIDVYILAAEGPMVKKYMLYAGAEGGRAGMNKISWDGMSSQGFMCGNGIYTGIISARKSKEILSRFKLTIVN